MMVARVAYRATPAPSENGRELAALHGDDLVHTADSEVKLTVVMNLSSDCDGGKFAFIDSESGHREMVDLPVGHALVYQASESYTQVTEVTSGELFQLAAFFIA